WYVAFGIPTVDAVSEVWFARCHAVDAHRPQLQACDLAYPSCAVGTVVIFWTTEKRCSNLRVMAFGRNADAKHSGSNPRRSSPWLSRRRPQTDNRPGCCNRLKRVSEHHHA